MNTSASFLISNRTVNGISDNYVNCGQVVMTRQFNQTTWPTGSWHDIWIGFRFRADFFPVTHSSTIDYDNGSFSFGICKTNQPVFGQSSSNNPPSHYMGPLMFRRDLGEGYMSSVQYATSNSISSSALTYDLTFQHVSGSSIAFPIGAGYSVPITAFSGQNVVRNLMIARIYTGSNATTWSLFMLYSKPLGFSVDISSSVYLPTIMGQSSWTAATASAFSLFPGCFDTKSFSNIIYSNQSVDGYFDGIYYTWDKYYTNIQVSDVVLKIM